MLLEDVSVRQLQEMLEPHMHKPAWPGLMDKRVKTRARKYAKTLGIWERISKQLSGRAASRDINVLRLSSYREYEQGGSQEAFNEQWFGRVVPTELAALALWLEHPAADLDYLHDLLWSWCDTATWTHAAHADVERPALDLTSTRLGCLLAEILWMFDDRLEPRVKQRVGREIERRILDRVYDWRSPHWWRTVRMNWSHVCNANLICTALYRIRDPEALASFIHPLCVYLDYGLQGYADDGGCLEGASYWDYGFGHFVDAAVVMHHRTGGRLDLMTGEKTQRICRYPLAVDFDGPNRASYSDCTQGFYNAETMLKVNRFVAMPELYSLADRTRKGLLNVDGWRGLALYRGEKAPRTKDDRDFVLLETGFAKLRASRRKSTVIGVLAGKNDWPHNHNDIGSFTLYADKRFYIVDPGAPTYTKETFGPRRYEILFCRSRGHSVPVINGKEQPGVEHGDYKGGLGHFGTLRVQGDNRDGAKHAIVEMAHAYDDRTLRRLTREFVLAPDGSLTLTDAYEFSRKPRSVEEAFVTFLPARVTGGGKSVVIGTGSKTLRLTAVDASGRFAVQRLVEESETGRTKDVLSRITFEPDELEKNMTLTFLFIAKRTS